VDISLLKGFVSCFVQQKTWDKRSVCVSATNKAKAVELLWVPNFKNWARQFRHPQLTALHRAIRAHAFSFLAKPMLTMREHHAALGSPV